MDREVPFQDGIINIRLSIVKINKIMIKNIE